MAVKVGDKISEAEFGYMAVTDADSLETVSVSEPSIYSNNLTACRIAPVPIARQGVDQGLERKENRSFCSVCFSFCLEKYYTFYTPCYIALELSPPVRRLIHTLSQVFASSP